MHRCHPVCHTAGHTPTGHFRPCESGRFAALAALLSLLFVLPLQPLQAQEAASPESGLPLWEVGAFAGALSTPHYPASSQQNRRAIVLPFLIYRGEFWRSDREGVGARLLRTDTLELDVGFAASLPSSSDDIELRRGMPDLGTLIEFGPRLKIGLAEPGPGQRLSLELPLRAVLEFNGGVRQVGTAFEPRLAYGWRLDSDWRLGGSLSFVLGDQQLNQYFYGVPAAYATANRPAFEAQAGLISTRLGLQGVKRMGPDVSLFVYARHDLHAQAANRSSPLFGQNQGSSVGLGLAWTLGRSESRAGALP
jgi:outer membrane scaffolding protein for murein synthesis (MipA/OmpV family)